MRALIGAAFPETETVFIRQRVHQVLAAFLDPAFGLTDVAAVTAYRAFGGGANQAAVLLRDRGRNPGQLAGVLTQAGYDRATMRLRSATRSPPRTPR
jgi:hypothetical protein